MFAVFSVPARRRTLLVDAAVALGVGLLFYLVIRVGSGTMAPLGGDDSLDRISTDPSVLPYYAARTLLRMFAALALSVVFTAVVGTLAARSRRAEKIILPALDILQSVPILGFLSVTVTGFMALSPGSTLGVEFASVFAIFTSQAWNMAYAWYQALRVRPRELDEAATTLGLTRWQRFWRLDAPSTTIPLLWNGMMSFGGGWFFVVAAEAISVGNRTYALPGIGSYVAAATARAEADRLLLAVGTMVLLVLVVNVLFWRPLTAWAERFRVEETEAGAAPRSLVLDLLRRASLPRRLGAALGPVAEGLDRAARVFGRPGTRWAPPRARRRAGDLALLVAVLGLLAWGSVSAVDYLAGTVTWAELGHVAWLGLVTFARVVPVVVVASLVWVPLGVWIGLHPKVSRLAQPVVQVFASFPATFLFPLCTALLISTQVSLDWGGVLLMSLGAQWYVLFNVIAGASAIPADLREAAADLGVRRWLWWRRLVLPAVFPAWVTGALTAAGGAWNASIVSEVVTYGSDRLEATGLGAYISTATAASDFPHLLVGVAVMSAYVTALNSLCWRPLHAFAQRRFSL
ncbi:NitT/TauT family transport system permease protein [Crossiella equi]|uniref:NitT/TauT family transport system permease protein n=1 Tax=Crossiella equi TaxID=130796 RepID=A0ABS5AIY5_9PSEU|nr:ABC transporter permease subunit [Crossiella equi]MBP2476506.1 NitT/TauT family transport system permease protein [Crossiella equi]